RYWHMTSCSSAAALPSVYTSASRCWRTIAGAPGAAPPRAARSCISRPPAGGVVVSVTQGSLRTSRIVGPGRYWRRESMPVTEPAHEPEPSGDLPTSDYWRDYLEKGEPYL